LYVGNSLVDDNFFNGTPWEIGLKRFLPDAANSGIRIRILPLRQDAPIYLDARVRSRLPIDGEIAQVNSLTLKPEYEIVVTLSLTKNVSQKQE
jgi:beta-galactosidase